MDIQTQDLEYMRIVKNILDNDEFNKVRIKSSARINVHKIEGEETDRMWRFTNLDAMI